MLNLPIYLLGSSYYLHTRIAGKQFNRSLRTSYKREANGHGHGGNGQGSNIKGQSCYYRGHAAAGSATHASQNNDDVCVGQ